MERVLLGHGSGGRLMHHLIRERFAPEFSMIDLNDSATIDLAGVGRRLAFTTDSYVVSPLFFPGGDIGELAVNGTVNDLSMRGARPMYLSAGFILEEGLPMDALGRIAASMARACRQAAVQLVTGDTKVVGKGQGDG